MTTFDEREKGFEQKFGRDQELAFKVKARRNKLLGLWAAQALGLSGEAAERYAREVLQSDLEKPGVEVALDRLLDAIGIGHDAIAHREGALGRLDQPVQLIKALADQNAQLISRVETGRRRSQWIAAVAGLALVLAATSLTLILTR